VAVDLAGHAQYPGRVARLVVDGREDRQVELPGSLCLVGRLATCGLQLDFEPQSSRKHFHVERHGTRWILTDLGSRNGTYLNEERVEGSTPLRHGDQLRVGETVMLLECAPPALPVGTRLGNVELGTPSGRSEYGTLYRGKQGSLEREVTVELVDADLAGDPEVRTAYQRRARMAGAFEHPAVLAVFDANAEGEQLYTVFEAFSALTLEERLLAGAGLERDDALALLRDLAQAVSHVHQRGQLHGQLSPRAVLLEPNGAPKLHLLGEGPRARLRKHRADPAAHAAYASPEEAQGQPATRASDVYSLGVIAYRLLLGRLPFEGKPKDVLSAHASEPVPWPPTADPAIRDLLASLLAKSPGERMDGKDAGRAFADLVGLAASDPVHKTAARRPGSARAKRAGSARAKRAGSTSSARNPAKGSSSSARNPAKGSSSSARNPTRGSSGREKKGTSGRAPRSEGKPPSSDRIQRQSSSALRQAMGGAPRGPDPEATLALRLILLTVGYGLVFCAAALATRVVLKLV
jgi:serine/threonine protein kinase